MIGTGEGSLGGELIGGVLPWVIVVGAAGFVPALTATRGWIASPAQVGIGLCALTAATYFGSWGPAEVYIAAVCLTLPYFIVAAVAVATGRPKGIDAARAQAAAAAVSSDASPDKGERSLAFDRGDAGETDAEEVRRAA